MNLLEVTGSWRVHTILSLYLLCTFQFSPLALAISANCANCANSKICAEIAEFALFAHTFQFSPFRFQFPRTSCGHILCHFPNILKCPQKSVARPFLPENQCSLLNYAAWRKWRRGFRHFRHLYISSQKRCFFAQILAYMHFLLYLCTQNGGLCTTK